MEDLIYIEKESVKKMIQRLGGATKCEMIALLAFMPRVQIKTNEDVISRSDAIKSAWIPCSERLPSKGVPVLVNGIMEDAPPITISNDAPLYYENGWINAWMPLPEPWEGAGDE